ncbi:MAG: hypothetical protein ACI8UO_004449 [Verrucomicrobiales bacterium]|jgi:hypothetical protein
MALRHELAHVRKRDGAWQLLGAIVAILHWPNPLVWLGLRQLGREREICADAEVVRSGISPSAYSNLLVRLASSSPIPAAALPMARESTVPMRVDRILRGDSGKVALGPLLWLTIGLLAGIGLTLGVTALAKPKEPEQIKITTRFVEVAPDADAAAELFTKVFLVPPGFLASKGADPFAELDGGGATPLTPRKTPREVLEEAGISFPDRSSAIFNPSISQLVVRNTRANLDLVEAYVDSLSVVQKQVYITTKVFSGPPLSELEFEETPYSRVFATGSTFTPNNSTEAEANQSIGGVLSDPQIQAISRAIEKSGKHKVLAMPSIMAKSGQRAKIEINPGPIVDLTPTIGADGYTIDLILHQTTSREVITVPASLTIWDGQTVLWTESLPDGQTRLLFVTARLVDPAGLPVDPPPVEDPFA